MSVGGEDLETFPRVIPSGHRIVYEPASTVPPRRTVRAIRPDAALRNWVHCGAYRNCDARLPGAP